MTETPDLCGDPEDDSWCCCVCNPCALCKEGDIW
jgi:hypothetical protein